MEELSFVFLPLCVLLSSHHGLVGDVGGVVPHPYGQGVLSGALSVGLVGQCCLEDCNVGVICLYIVLRPSQEYLTRSRKT